MRQIVEPYTLSHGVSTFMYTRQLIFHPKKKDNYPLL